MGDSAEKFLSALLMFSLVSSVSSLIHPSKTSAIPEAVSLAEYQKAASSVAASFEPGIFDPVPFLSNCHVQTIGGFFLRDNAGCQNVRHLSDALVAVVKATMDQDETQDTSFWHTRERIETPDNDWFHVDSIRRRDAKGLMILLHGLESSSESSLSKEIARAYFDLGLNVTCINFRSCSGEPNDQIGAYHLGFTDDLKHYLELVAVGSTTPIYLSGFSLGANVMIKTLGEIKGQAVERYNIRGAAAFCVPLDCERNAPRLATPGINRVAYTNTMLANMKEKAKTKLTQFCDGNQDTAVFDFKGAMNAETVVDFETAFIAPLYGFEDAYDYYRKTSSIYFLEDVAVPLLILNAKDDPFMESTYFPIEKTTEFGGVAPVKMVQSEYGGHCGFLFNRVKPGETPKYSWGSAEMMRFIQHVMSKENE